MTLPADFDPDGPGSGGLFGLPHSIEQARVAVLPVPYEATTSFGQGTAEAPDAVLEASWQVDLSDPETGEPWRAGIAMDAAPDWLPALATEARAAADRARDGDDDALALVNDASARLDAHVVSWTTAQLDAGRIPAILGGDHSVPHGAHRVVSERFPGIGVLHVDAHADLRHAYEGFSGSHASIFDNARALSGLGPVVQVGIRDQGTAERRAAAEDPRIHQWTDDAIAMDGGLTPEVAARMVEPLPPAVWISFDVDGLDPALCPGTGTPVPGGLSWREAMILLRALGTSGRRIVGFDLCEVGPTAWDANVGARLLYKLCGWAAFTNPTPERT